MSLQLQKRHDGAVQCPKNKPALMPPPARVQRDRLSSQMMNSWSHLFNQYV